MSLLSEREMILRNNKYCWIHISDLRLFLYLGANEYEEKIGQNLRIDLSLKIRLTGTKDNLANTVDYGAVCNHVTQQVNDLKKVKLIEYLAEVLLDSIGENFKEVAAAKISIEKGYIPLSHFTGKVRIEAHREYLI